MPQDWRGTSPERAAYALSRLHAEGNKADRAPRTIDMDQTQARNGKNGPHQFGFHSIHEVGMLKA
jgi:hypothetical protein